MAFVEAANRVRAVAGYRLLESLYAGRHYYVDDLVTDAEARSSGYGGILFDWLVAEARARASEIVAAAEQQADELRRIASTDRAEAQQLKERLSVAVNAVQ